MLSAGEAEVIYVYAAAAGLRCVVENRKTRAYEKALPVEVHPDARTDPAPRLPVKAPIELRPVLAGMEVGVYHRVAVFRPFATWLPTPAQTDTAARNTEETTINVFMVREA